MNELLFCNFRSHNRLAVDAFVAAEEICKVICDLGDKLLCCTSLLLACKGLEIHFEERQLMSLVPSLSHNCSCFLGDVDCISH
jgi:hypothetical protein